MKDPKIIETVTDKSTYSVPTFSVTNEGIIDADPFVLMFCKGDKSDESKTRQTGFFTETLLETCAEYLRQNNVGELASRETSMAITKIDEALMWIQKRADDRKRRGVQQTYNK